MIPVFVGSKYTILTCVKLNNILSEMFFCGFRGVVRLVNYLVMGLIS